MIPDPQQTPVIPLWPDVGKILGLCRSSTFEAAKRGEIPGLITFGRRKVVATATLLAALGLHISASDGAIEIEVPGA